MNGTLHGTTNGTFRGAPSGAYQKTHPWITFRADLAKAPYQFWMDLGAVQSKIEHVANALLPPKVAESLHNVYLAKGVHGTTAIEGNTLTEDQVRERIAGKTNLPQSKEYLGRECDNIIQALNTIGGEVFAGDDCHVTPQRIRQFNEMVLRDLPVEEGIVPGAYRHHSVVVGKYRGAPHADCPALIDCLCDWLESLKAPSREFETGFAVIRAVLAHLYIAWIHPFGDGNGRTARLVEFQILLAGSVPSVAAHLLSNFYNQTRTEYYRQLSAASQSGGNIMPFLRYAVCGLRDALDEQINTIRMHQWGVAWRDYVYSRFRGMKGDAADRRRLLALELAKANPCEVPAAEVRHMTPEIAELYASKTGKTLVRDLNELEEMELIVRKEKTVMANGGLLAQLLPSRRNSSPAISSQPAEPEQES